MRFVLARRGVLDQPDGINVFIFSLSQELLSLGHDVTVVGTTLEDESRIDTLFGMRLYPRFVLLRHLSMVADTHGAVTAARLYFVRDRVDGLNPDLIVLNGAVPFAFRSRSCAVVHDAERRTPFGFLQAAYKRLAYSKSTCLIATCTEVRDAVTPNTGLAPAAIRVIPTCVDLSVYAGIPLSGREDAILHVGTAPYKNPVAAIRAFTLLGESRTNLYMTGRMTEAVRHCLEALDHEKRARIHFLGIISAQALREMLGRVRAVFAPSKYVVPVASPTVIEAFASGTPVIALDSITSDLLRAGVNGFACVDETEMAARYAQLMADETLWKTMSKAALSAAANYSARRVAESYLGLT